MGNVLTSLTDATTASSLIQRVPFSIHEMAGQTHRSFD